MLNAELTATPPNAVENRARVKQPRKPKNLVLRSA
jgi:hypothetical protein